MILQELEAYYRRIAAEGDQDGTSDLVMPGFSRQNITFCVDLLPDGTLATIRDERDATGKKPVSRKVLVLGSSKPSGQGINPCFLWDNTSYVLGFKPNDEKPERTRQTFEAFRQRHLDLQAVIDCPEFDAICNFLRDWQPERALEFPVLNDLATGFGVFHIVGQEAYVHQIPKIQNWWLQQANVGADEPDSSASMQCLLTGENRAIAKVHEPKIQGVNGAQSAGALLVSFNFKAAESYGREQSFVAPVSKEATFRYAVALNRLLERAGGRRVQIGDATTVFWTDKRAPIEGSFMGMIDGGDVEDQERNKQLQATLSRLSRGMYAEELGPPETQFFVLGLSPNAARLSVRFWWRGTIEQIAKNLGAHFDDLAIVKPPAAPEHPAAWQLLRETAREAKDIPPTLSGSLMRSILSGSDYSPQLLQSLLRRIKADGAVSPIRAAATKACLNRTYRLFPNRSPLTARLEVSLNPDRPETAYQLGRLFAVLEKTQEDAFKGSVNATIKDRFFSAASATPAVVFPRLIRMNQHHVGKLEKDSYRIAADRRMQEVFARIDTFPSHLPMSEQGLFAIGYYHQRQDFFTKKGDTADET